jgi:hypothetical protein
VKKDEILLNPMLCANTCMPIAQKRKWKARKASNDERISPDAKYPKTIAGQYKGEV